MARKQKTNISFDQEAEIERAYYEKNRLAFFRDCLRVKDREGTGLIPFSPLPGQLALMRLRDNIEKFHAEISKEIGETYKRPISIQVLKARRGGFSTLIEADMFHFCEFHKGVNGLVVAHQNSNADNVAQISRRFEQQFPKEKAHLKIPIPKMGEVLEWGEVEGQLWDSRILIATAASKNFARGFDFSFVHLSECAHYPNPDAVASAKDAAQFAKVIYEESTANGMDPYFYQSWQNALHLSQVRDHWKKHGTLPENWNGKYKFFWAWWQDPAYRTPLTTTQADSIMETLTDIELDGVQKFAWSAEQIEWRRRKIAGDCSEQTLMDPESYFDQEYPSNPEAAFISSGKSVYPTIYLSELTRKSRGLRPKLHGYIKGFDRDGAIIQKPKKDSHAESPVIIWEHPRPGDQYVIGARTAEGLKHTDYSVVKVFNRTNGKHLREVASYRGQSTGIELADICLWLGYKYNTAFIIPEALIPTLAQRLVAKRYPYVYLRRNEEKIGGELAKDNFVPGFKCWRTNKQMVIHHSQDAFRKEEIEIKTPWSIGEHIQFVNIDGNMQAPHGETDDGVICTALAVFAHRNAAPPINPKKPKRVMTENDRLMAAINKKKERSMRKNRILNKHRSRQPRGGTKGIF